MENFSLKGAGGLELLPGELGHLEPLVAVVEGWLGWLWLGVNTMVTT